MGNIYRLSVDYTLADQVVGDNGKVAFIPGVKLVNSGGTAIDPGGGVAQSSTTAGEVGPLVQGAVTTAAPTYVTAQTNPLSLTTSGALRTVTSGVDADAVAPTVNPIAAAGMYTSGSLGTLSTGQLGRINVDTYRNLRATFCGLSATGTDGFSNASLAYAQPDALGTRTLALFAMGTYVFNGGTWDRSVKPNATGRLLSSAATTNATSVKGSAGNVFKIVGNNTVASKRYLKLYNKASAPTVGTDTPVLTFVLAASAPFAIDLGPAGQYFATGIAFAITGAAADADTTAIAAGDIECLNLTYA
jgi:hypothetical protein